MNTLLSPISGIITVIHLVIIFLAEIVIAARIFFREKVMGQIGVSFNSTGAHSTPTRAAPAWAKKILSTAIIFSMLTVITWSSAVTVIKAMNSSPLPLPLSLTQ